MKRALVTGDMGFVGRHVRAELEVQGWETHGLDVKRRESDDVRYALAHPRLDLPWRYDLVVHCAAVVGGLQAREDDPLALAVNLAIDAEMFSWAVRTKPGRLVYLSSSAVYPTYMQTDLYRDVQAYLQKPMLLKESDVDLENLEGTPHAMYGWGKLTGEMLAKYAREAGLKVTVVRPFSGYGSDQDIDYPFPTFIQRAKQRQDPFEIWGDGQQTRDWLHIDDFVGAILACVEQEVDGPLNLCTGRSTSFVELAGLCVGAASYVAGLDLKTEAPSSTKYRVGDPTRMLEVYQPRVTLEEGITRALKDGE